MATSARRATNRINRAARTSAAPAAAPSHPGGREARASDAGALTAASLPLAIHGELEGERPHGDRDDVEGDEHSEPAAHRDVSEALPREELGGQLRGGDERGNERRQGE